MINIVLFDFQEKSNSFKRDFVDVHELSLLSNKCDCRIFRIKEPIKNRTFNSLDVREIIKLYKWGNIKENIKFVKIPDWKIGLCHKLEIIVQIYDIP